MNAPVKAEQSGAVRLQLGDYLPYRLSVASDAVSRLIARAYQARFGLSIPEWRLVAVLAEDGVATPGALVARTGMDKVSISRAAQGLSRRRLVERRRRAEDRRSHDLALTTDGAALHAEIAPLALAYEAALIAGLTPQEVVELKRLLSRLQGAAAALAGEAAPPR